MAGSEVSGTDILHVVDDPSGTPVNKRLSIANLFENIPTHLAINDLNAVSASGSINDGGVVVVDNDSISANMALTLSDSSDVGEIKIVVLSTDPWKLRCRIDTFNFQQRNNNHIHRPR